jgi:hypothetical protein
MQKPRLTVTIRSFSGETRKYLQMDFKECVPSDQKVKRKPALASFHSDFLGLF